MLNFLKKQWFVCAILLVLIISWLLPPLPDGQGQDWLKKGFIAAIFLGSGLALRSKELLRGLGHWRLHLFIQGFSLVITALMCWGLDQLWRSIGLDPGIRLGLLVLGALPTTVTSCVALTAAAGGNQAGALVNASLGNLLGVIITPLWLIAVADAGEQPIDLLPTLQKLGILVIAPLLLGQVIQALLGQRLSIERRKQCSKMGQVLLLGVMYISFQYAFHHGTAMNWGAVAATSLICIALHGLWLLMPWYGALLPPFRLNPGDRCCALICSSQKTLAFGLPLIAICFPQHPALALIALPILIYHPLQLLIGAGLAPILAKMQRRAA